ncbi:MAG: CPBP family glutamic-type intramembrane protease, partial [Candidatus Heimdallarchaeaceae archaeon]
PVGINVPYSIVVYIACTVIFVLYSWLIRRRFIKNGLDRGDDALLHTFKSLLPIFGLSLIYTVSIYVSPLRNSYLLTTISNSIFEILQLTVFASLLGILCYNYIENYLGPLFFKAIVHEETRTLGIGLFRRQTKDIFSRYWKNGLIFLGLIIAFANLIVFIIYPSIPTKTSSSSIAFIFPNFLYHYDPSLGLRQDIFNFITIPKSIFIDWKLLQSILCLAIFVFMFLLIYFPRNQKRENNIEKNQQEHPLEEEDQNSLAYNILSPDVHLEEYSPSGLITTKTSKRFSNFYKRAITSDLIPVMALLSFNFALSFFIIALLTNFGVPIQSSIDFDVYYIQLSKLYWAGFNEEFTFRFLLFGLPLFVIYGAYYLCILLLRLIRSYKVRHNKEVSNFLKKLSERSPINPLLYLCGRWKKIRLLDILFLLLSSFAFGFVHYQVGYPFWDVGKIVQAGIIGIIFAYAYAKYGLHVAIFLHAANDFIIGFISTPDLGLMANGTLLLLLLSLFGGFYLIFVISKTLGFVLSSTNRLLGRTSLISDKSIIKEK